MLEEWVLEGMLVSYRCVRVLPVLQGVLVSYSCVRVLQVVLECSSCFR